LFLLILKNLRRNVLRTSLTAVAIMALVFIVTMIWTVVFYLDRITEEKAKDFKLIVTERWQLPSQMPPTHANYLNPNHSDCLPAVKTHVGPLDFMTWSFYGGSLDPTKMTRENLVFFFVMEPDHIQSMMDDLEDIEPELIAKLKATRNGCLMGREKLASINKRVGESFKVTSINYKDINLDFEIVGLLKDGRYNQSAIMRADYFNAALEQYKDRNGGKAHPLANKTLNLVWLRVRDRTAFENLAADIENNVQFTTVPVKCETAASGIGSFLDAYRDLIWGVRCILVPVILISMALVIANAISISVRERRGEMAVMKVIGFRPWQILALVLGESLLVGGIAGLLAGRFTYGIMNLIFDGIPFRVGFFPVFYVPIDAFWWGLGMGFFAALAGSLLPSWSARSVRVSEVFAKVA